MSEGVYFKPTGPIGDTDTDALPVKEIGPAVGYDTGCLGFTTVSNDEATARLRRDGVEIGLAVNGQAPEQASCFDGKPCRVFSAEEPFGVCSCSTRPLAQEA